MTSPLRVGLAFAALVSLPAVSAPAQDTSLPDPANHGFVLISESPSSAFVDATATHMPAAPSLHATDSVLIDLDGYGDLDTVVSVEYGVRRLYLNGGDGRLVHRPSASGTAIHDNEHVRAADFDGDGHMDVVFVSVSEETHQPFLGDGRDGLPQRHRSLAGDEPGQRAGGGRRAVPSSTRCSPGSPNSSGCCLAKARRQGPSATR